MIPVRRAPRVATFAVMMAASLAAAQAAAAAPGDYGYGAQAARAGEPLDLRAALKPVRKIEPDALAHRAARAAPAETAALTSGPAAGAPIVFASAATRPQPAATPTPDVAPNAASAPAPVVEQGARPGPGPSPSPRPAWLEPERVGAPYEAKGVWYVPTPDPNYAETGRAVAFDAAVAGRRTAAGETYAPETIVAAHPTLPLPSLVQVTDLDTGRELIVRVVDRGPFEGRGLIALSPGALKALGAGEGGAARVHVRYLGPAPRRVGVETAAAPALAPTAPAPVAASPTLADATEAPGAFAVQVGAFGAQENAERARRIAAAAGPARVEAANGLHKVRVGPAATRAEAERLREAVAALGFPGAIVTRLR